MALGPDDPRSQKRLLGIILILGVGAAYWFYVHKPKAQELADMEDRIAQVEEQNRRASAQMGNLDELRVELRRMEQVYAALRDLVPPRAEVPALYEAIAEQVQTLGLELNNATPESPQPVEGSVYQRQRWQMEVEGPYHTLGVFLAQVASFPRIVRPVIQEIRPAGQTNTGDHPVVVSMGLEMFVLPPDTASAGQGQGGSDDAG